MLFSWNLSLLILLDYFVWVFSLYSTLQEVLDAPMAISNLRTKGNHYFELRRRYSNLLLKSSNQIQTLILHFLLFLCQIARNPLASKSKHKKMFFRKESISTFPIVCGWRWFLSIRFRLPWLHHLRCTLCCCLASICFPFLSLFIIKFVFICFIDLQRNISKGKKSLEFL